MAKNSLELLQDSGEYTRNYTALALSVYSFEEEETRRVVTGGAVEILGDYVANENKLGRPASKISFAGEEGYALIKDLIKKGVELPGTLTFLCKEIQTKKGVSIKFLSVTVPPAPTTTTATATATTPATVK